MTTFDKIKEINALEFENKHKILLEVLNKIMENTGQKSIVNVTDFVHVYRSDIIHEKNSTIVEELQEKIGLHFKKHITQNSLKSVRQHYLLTLLKNMCDELFLSFESSVILKKDETGKRKSYVVYSIFLNKDRDKN